MPRLLVEKGHDKGKSISLSSTSTIIIGRDSSADLQLRDTMASRMHFKIEPRTDGWWLLDLDSLNGTLHNNRPAKEALLSSGDLIKVGETLFSFLSDEQTVDDPLVGQRVGGYKILERVGRGGMGTVYKAEQVDLQRIVALKMISPEHLKSREFVELFVHEARAAAKLNHPNIVQVYDVKKFNAFYYFSMEFVPGGNVQELLNRQKRIPVQDALRMILDAAHGLQYAHGKEIIHRDIKPDNFMLSETGSIKIGDLGLAQRLGEKLSTDDEHSVIGTPHYIAPEQVLGKPADYRSDIYSLGATFFRMVSGSTPYQAPGVRDLISKKVREDAPPLHEVCPDIPEPLGRICAKMMSRQPNARYGSMTELITDLEQYRRQSTEVHTRPPAAAAPEGTVASRPLLVAAMILMSLIVVVAGVGAAIVLNRAAPSPTAPPDERSEEAANRALDTAKRLALRIDRNSAEDLLKAIHEFSDVEELYPATRAAAAALRAREECEGQLRLVRAWAEIANLEEFDRLQWTKMRQSFQAGSPDFSLLEETIRAYEDFREGAGKGTEAGERAQSCAAHIRLWLQRLRKTQEEFEAAKGSARASIDQRRYQEAWEIYDTFIARTRGTALRCEFAPDRYTTLLFDDSAEAEQKKVVERAAFAYEDVEEAASIRAEKAGDYEEAIRVLQPAIELSVTLPVVKRARARVAELETAWEGHRAAEARREKEERRRRIAEDAADFEARADKAREKCLLFNFREALDAFAHKGGPFPRTGEYESRLRLRTDLLVRLLDFKSKIIEVYGDSRDPYQVARKWQEEGGLMTGTIISASETGFQIQLSQGGEAERSFHTIPPRRLHSFLKSSWRRNVPVMYQMGLVSFCIEFGLYESALAELDALAKAEEYRTVPEIVVWSDRIRTAIEDGEVFDTPGIEADRRFRRVREALELAGEDKERRNEYFARASADLELLKVRFADTKFVAARRKEIEEFEARVKREGGRAIEEGRRKSQIQRLRQSRSAERSDAQKTLVEFRSRVEQRLKQQDRLEERVLLTFQLGEAEAAKQEWVYSKNQLQQAKNLLLRQIAQRTVENRREVAVTLTEVFLALMRNAVLSGRSDDLASFRGEANSLVLEEGNKGSFPFWSARLEEFAKWTDGVPKAHAAVRRLEAELEEQPDQAGLLWDLGRAYETLCNPVEARACFRTLIEVFPDAEPVRSGEALHRLAEGLYASRAVREAVDAYETLKERHEKYLASRKEEAPDNPRSVGARIRSCQQLIVRLYRGDAGRPREPK